MYKGNAKGVWGQTFGCSLFGFGRCVVSVFFFHLRGFTSVCLGQRAPRHLRHSHTPNWGGSVPDPNWGCNARDPCYVSGFSLTSSPKGERCSYLFYGRAQASPARSYPLLLAEQTLHDPGCCKNLGEAIPEQGVRDATCRVLPSFPMKSGWAFPPRSFPRWALKVHSLVSSGSLLVWLGMEWVRTAAARCPEARPEKWHRQLVP